MWFFCPCRRATWRIRPRFYALLHESLNPFTWSPFLVTWQSCFSFGSYTNMVSNQCSKEVLKMLILLKDVICTLGSFNLRCTLQQHSSSSFSFSPFLSHRNSAELLKPDTAASWLWDTVALQRMKHKQRCCCFPSTYPLQVVPALVLLCQKKRKNFILWL